MKGKNKHNSDSDDDGSDGSVEVDTDNSPKYIPVAKLGDKPKTKKIVINIWDTQYPIVQEIAEELGWVVQKQEGVGDWDLWWTDREIQPHTLFRMNLHQKINHFPGIYILARKNLFGLGLMAMQQYYPQEYNFFPETWAIPLQFSQFRHYYQSVQKGKIRTYIVKPQALSQGRGIFLTRNIQDILNGNKYVVQKYIKNPLLIDRLKFDLRIYVLLAGTDPLRLYIYHEGLTRFATQAYQEPTTDNLSRSYIHLTNYSLNKNNPNYVFNTSEKDMDKGHKRTLSSTYQRLAKDGIDVQALKANIEDAIVKSVISGLPSIRHQYQYCQPEQYQGNMCFHILGFDVMLTDDLKPIVIEVNHTPSFQTATPLDYLVKKNLIKDTLKLMRITQKNKRKNFQRAKQIAKARLQTGRREILKGKEREEVIKKARQIRDQLQKDIMGGYKRIFPPYDPQLEAKYNRFYQTALKISREDSDARKKLLNQQKKKQQLKKEKMKPKVQKKGDGGKEQLLKQQKQAEQLQLKEQLYSKSSKQKQRQVQYKTINELDKTQRISQQNTLPQPPLHYLQQEMIESISQATAKADLLKNSFRTKVSKRKNGSNQQLVKYTQSIKKFNELMVRFVVAKQIPNQLNSQFSPNIDCEAFQKLKQKICLNREGKSSSQGGYPSIIRDNRWNALAPAKGFSPSGIQCLKIQVRNGSFIKPKNYIISESKESNLLKNAKRAEEEVGREVDGLLGGLIVENRSSKAYSKLLKPQVGRGLGLGLHH